ncbi:hypothetical protein [Bradyrhizobium sp. CCBAU 51753]|uniref:hypothetical protein n=1 Tax=Bradyrhizobium sp. CCBAU 51753 TaxID=1325100 RepID=UPI00188AE2F9|nr:hypothetical protein [Bradyrhizobium sp. CCBAU 51753]
MLVAIYDGVFSNIAACRHAYFLPDRRTQLLMPTSKDGFAVASSIGPTSGRENAARATVGIAKPRDVAPGSRSK